ncbi:polysaccharide deacetylase family protein [Salinirubellus salinus]|uniref:Polysaccharide deacetylase family protein n=1 Tax=Salinirubellus salinus TaxID=1364945 RepID=A0A9E7UAG8_9EURY|nr:polysaccharide deacetylase family protein [Salinirubellus salinus]UWM54243.1 polysaccharide deacetylase family protein [Salinirubellus salinus]
MNRARPSLATTDVFGARTGAPAASVVVVTYETPAAELARTFAALGRQTDPAFELLVVDNGTGHDPEPLLRRTGLSGTWYGLERNVGPNLARDFAAERADGDLLVFLDDDAVPADDFVASHLEAYREGAMAVRGRVLPLTRSVYNRLATNYDLGDDDLPYLLDIEGNTAIDRETYLDVGGFGDVPWGHEGLVLTERLLELVDREVVRYDPRPVVYHDYACSLAELVDIRVRHARAARELGDHESALDLYREYTLPANPTLQVRLTDVLLYVLGETIDRLTAAALRVGEVASALVGDTPRSRDAVLMYHSVGERERYGNVSVERFREDLARLVDAYEVVDLAALLADEGDGDRPRVAITVDDAYANFHDHALPIVEEFGVPVTLFVPVGLLDGEHPEFASRLERSPDGDPRFNDPDHGETTPAPLMTSEQVRAALETGLVTLGNHTMTHPDLATVAPEALATEVREARRRLEREFGVTVDRFCYPYGRYSAAALALVRETHSLAVTAEDEPLGSNVDPHRIPRLHAHDAWWESLSLPGSEGGDEGTTIPVTSRSYKSHGGDAPTEMPTESTTSPAPDPGEGR